MMRDLGALRCSSLLVTVVLVVACGGGNPSIAEDESEADSSSGSGGNSVSTSGPSLSQAGSGSTGGSCSDDKCEGTAGTGGASAEEYCGDGELSDDESCDDGNATPGDGCNGKCEIESGYVCETPSEPCISVLECGDGLYGPGEVCDDGNTVSGDGCKADCSAVESGYACSAWGEACTVTTAQAVCGNSDIEYGETCDDGNDNASDGCSGTCQTESGYACPTVGEPCELDEYCGDGILNGQEQCDDGNTTTGDCCSATCKLEANCACTTPTDGAGPQSCESTMVCGDGQVTGGELCDDGNTTGGDGCKADCSDVESGYDCPVSGGACTPESENCCNSKLNAGETCDDGNATTGDGCSSGCQVETGYICSSPTETTGSVCSLQLYCGDGKVTYHRGETCDDGNSENGDGCSESCTVEEKYVCVTNTATGTSECSPSVVCGDGRLGLDETCDDGNASDGDGCSSSCLIEDGFTCAAVRLACKAICGDGLVRGSEQCDDGDTENGDGCSASCTVEVPGDDEGDAWECTEADADSASVCARTDCGNGVLEGSEQCDDGDNDMGDGCTPFCRVEPSCPVAGGACNTSCGDGILLDSDVEAGQQCDDGNTVSGDGCSSTCKIEDGYECTTQTVVKTSLTLPIVLRDFTPTGTYDHPDFEAYSGFEQGIVQSLLDADGKPAHVTSNKSTTTNAYSSGELVGTDYFAAWYRDNASYNKTFLQTLSFSKETTGEFSYTNNAFYPLNNLGFGNYYNNRNYHFTSEVRYWFKYQGNEQLEFMGDDDVWVFVNKQLAVDLGGVHSSVYGSVVLDDTDGTGTVCENAAIGCASPDTIDLGLTLGSVYEIVVFQAERHTVASNYTLTLGNFNVPRSVCEAVCGDGTVTTSEQCDLGEDEAGNSLNTGAYGGCTDECTLASYCGDKAVDSSDGEECDNGVNATAYSLTEDTSTCAPDCKYPHYCGDGNLDSSYGEICDDGENNATSDSYGEGLCLVGSCTFAPYCGDGTIDSAKGEACDNGDGNGTVGNACDSSCQLACGNGVVDAGEQCDAGTADNTGNYGGCRSNCTMAAYCGDGIKNGSEQCDDGLNDGSYGTCTASCTLAPYCGDGTKDGSEECDEGAGNVDASIYDAKHVGLCTERCKLAAYCGDGAVDSTDGERCDDGASNSDVTAGACRMDCSGYNDPPASCGNGVKNSGEECDDGATNGTDSSLCDSRCQYKCGNGIKEDDEECDDGTNDGSYGTCKADCTLAEYCGDGAKNGSEQCDLGDDNEVSPYGKGKCTTACQRAPYCGDGRVYAAKEECDDQTGCLSTCEWDFSIT